jgi:multiple sugar transport system substrate-binding protein
MVVLFVVITMISACGAGGAGGDQTSSSDAPGKADTATKPKEEKHDPLTLKLYQYGLALTDSDFTKLFADPVKKKFPYITLELVRMGKGMQPEDLLAAGDFPDILFSSNGKIPYLTGLGVLADLNSQVKKNNTALTRFEPDILNVIKNYAAGGEVYALPFSRNFSPLFYNKDLFDKFGVSYPKDGLTWNDVHDLAQKLSRSDGGVNYRGFDYGQVPDTAGSILSLGYVNPKTNKAIVNTDSWKKVFTLLQGFYTIPGNMPDKADFGDLNKIRKEFTEGRLAMFIDKGNGLVPQLQDLDNQHKPLNWDLTASPNFPEAPGIEGRMDIHLFEVYAKGKHQDDAFKVIDYLTSKEIEMLASGGGRVTSLTDKAVQNNYGKELSALKGKHLEAIFKSKPAPLPPTSDYDGLVQKQVTAAFKSVVLDGQDINSALRSAQEAADKAIAEELAK